MNGAGKYDDVCTIARRMCDADGAVLIIINGCHGNAFEVQVPPRLLGPLPTALREIADKIEADRRAGPTVVRPA